MRVVLGFLAALAQAEPPAAPPVDQQRVEAAIKKGIEYLRTTASTPIPDQMADTDELNLWTLIEVGIPEDDPKVESLFKKMLASKLERTYKVALQAMILEEVDRVKYQNRILQCAQFLLDNQCRNGQWSYGEYSQHVETVITSASRKDVPTEAEPAKAPSAEPKAASTFRLKPRVRTRIRITKKRDGPATGDNSNAQYAALGLRACHEAGIQLPQDAITLARKWWVDSQYAVREKAVEAPRTETPTKAAGTSADPKGWCYRQKGAAGCRASDRPYASMTAGGIGALLIYDFILSKDRKSDPSVQKGLAWMARNYSVTENPGPCENSDERPAAYLAYYLYALGRLGALYGTEKIGGHEWYPEGAKVFLDTQNANGSWKITQSAWIDQVTWDTCFAVLFLRRGTRPLEDVASEDKFIKGGADQK